MENKKDCYNKKADYRKKYEQEVNYFLLIFLLFILLL